MCFSVLLYMMRPISGPSAALCVAVCVAVRVAVRVAVCVAVRAAVCGAVCVVVRVYNKSANTFFKKALQRIKRDLLFLKRAL